MMKNVGISEQAERPLRVESGHRIRLVSHAKVGSMSAFGQKQTLDDVQMSDQDWRLFFATCVAVLAHKVEPGYVIGKRCSWATFDSIRVGAHYWSATALPREEDLAESYLRDQGPWGQPFIYQEIAHVVIPKEFDIESAGQGTYEYRVGIHDLGELSRQLSALSIQHRTTALMLEVKLY